MAVVMAALSAQAWTVHFTNPDNWPEVAVWAWDDDTDNKENFTGGVWPGKLMTKDGNVWTYTGEGAPTHVIFNNNNNGSQTKTFAFEDGATYDMYGKVGSEFIDYKVYCTNEAQWDNVYVYTFDNEYFGGWPGTQMTKGADGIYEATIRSTEQPKSAGIIFNNGKGTGQTEDLVFEVGKTYSDLPGTLTDYVIYWDNTGIQFETPYITSLHYFSKDDTTSAMCRVEGENNIWVYILPPGSVNLSFSGVSMASGESYGQQVWTMLWAPRHKHVYSEQGDLGEYQGIHTGIVDVETDATDVAETEEEAVYYDLYGRRVENVAKGIFIKMVDGKATKVLVK